MKTHCFFPIALSPVLCVNGFTPAPLPPPPALVKIMPANQKDHRTLTSPSSAISDLKLTSALTPNKLTTIVPLPRPMHRQANKILNITPLFGPNGPRVHDIVQGDSGDCYLMALLAALAQHQPQRIQDVFELIDRSETIYNIKYYHPVTMDRISIPVFDTSYVDLNKKPIYAGDPKGTPNNQGVSWVKLLENWFAKMNELYNLLNEYPGFEGISHGGWAVIPFELLTGESMEILNPKTLNSFESMLHKADDANIVILISNSKTFSEYYFPASHAYAVLSSHQDGTTTVYNPTGKELTLDNDLLFKNTARVILEVPKETELAS